jgi:hypothetical protein
MNRNVLIAVIAVFMMIQTTLSISAQSTYIGEQATYKLTYLSISAVTITISVPEKKRTTTGALVHVVATAKTNAFFSTFYSLDNRYDIYIDSATLLPVRMDKSIHQKTLEQRMTVSYRHRDGEATFDGGKFSTPQTSPIVSDAHNFFSMIYWLRHQPLKTGDLYSLHLDVETEPWLVSIRVIGEEPLTTTGLSRQAVKIGFTFIPTQEEKNRKKTDILTRRLVTSKSKLFFWLAKDEPHPFLKVEFEMSPFNVITELTGLQ